MRPDLAGRVRRLAALRKLPWRVAWFQVRADRVARELDDEWGLVSATGLDDLATLIELARGRRAVAELGTARGWTAISLALAHPARRVYSYDSVVHEHRERYLGLVDPAVRQRISLVHAVGADAAQRSEPVDFLFIDSIHDREGTLAEFRAWRPRLRSGAVVAFHDYRHPEFPGVAEAIEELGLEGQVRGGLFVWRAPTT